MPRVAIEAKVGQYCVDVDGGTWFFDGPGGATPKASPLTREWSHTRVISPDAILEYHDGVQLFPAVGQDGQQYIVLLPGDERHPGAYLVATMKPGDLQAFRNGEGEADLRSLILRSPETGRFTASALDHAGQLRITPLAEPLEQSDLLPDAGYCLRSGADPEDSGRNAPLPPYRGFRSFQSPQTRPEAPKPPKRALCTRRA